MKTQVFCVFLSYINVIQASPTLTQCEKDKTCFKDKIVGMRYPDKSGYHNSWTYNVPLNRCKKTATLMANYCIKKQQLDDFKVLECEFQCTEDIHKDAIDNLEAYMLRDDCEKHKNCFKESIVGLRFPDHPNSWTYSVPVRQCSKNETLIADYCIKTKQRDNFKVLECKFRCVKAQRRHTYGPTTVPPEIMVPHECTEEVKDSKCLLQENDSRRYNIRWRYSLRDKHCEKIFFHRACDFTKEANNFESEDSCESKCSEITELTEHKGH